MYIGKFWSRKDVEAVMDALDVLGKTYRITKFKVTPVPYRGDTEWIIEELSEDVE
ncbi:hypothetical protein [Paenibacillus sp. P13VS]|uniref:hypothetical protein n=1 Tax=Paenibacillus sp. P13VS TaxID=2697367 RepID=UPI00187B421D|nr:hypothetical protein [Paenibacillus sp. P13VS]MBE7682039.1 hypothetical protein [Paenibacillus sp. P13VS]